MKRLTLFFAAIVAAVCLSAQTVLPNDPEVRVGKLDNGMTYFIRHNEIPAGKCEFYLVTNAGAINQGEGQDGLAHFLEHMCFNGLRSMPGKQMLDYLQSIGAAFGPNINAWTNIDVTSYMLNDMPLTREGILDTCLLVMHDYSHFVTCDPKEVEAERGVILEEKRTRNTAQWRQMEQVGPYIYGNTKYATAYKDLIGSEQTLRNFKPETLVDFYHTWYRPDLQAVIVVGDVDVDKIEAKLKALFADIPAVENPRKFEDITIPDNDRPLIGVITDPEIISNTCEFYWRVPAIPMAMRNTDQAFAVRLIGDLTYRVMDERFGEITTKPDAPFRSALLGSTSLIKSTTDAVIGQVAFNNGDDRKAIEAFLYQVEKLKRYGVTEAELERAKQNVISELEKKVTGSSSRQNPDFIYPIIGYFTGNIPYMEPQTELEVTRAVCGQLTSQIVNTVLKQYITDKNMSVVLCGTSKVGHPTEGEILSMIENSRTMEVEAPKEEVAVTSLLDTKKIKAGKIRSTQKMENGEMVFVLSNGMEAHVLPTEYKKDEVVINLCLPGGKSIIEDNEIYTFEDNTLSCINNSVGLGDFSRSELMKALSGKSVSVSTYLEEASHGINCTTAPKDIETAMQLMYMKFMKPRFDESEFEVAMNLIRSYLPNMMSMPNMQFNKRAMLAMHENGPRNIFVSEETVAKASLENYRKVYSRLYNNVAGASLYIVGNVNIDSIKPLLERYVASLPKGKKAAQYVDRGERLRAGVFEDRFSVAMEAPKVSVFQFYNARFETSVENRVALQALQYILNMAYTDKLREEEGGTYGAGVYATYQREPVGSCFLIVQFDTNEGQASQLEKIARDVVSEIAKNGPSDDYFNRTVEYYKAQLPQSRISNQYWLSYLVNKYRYNEEVDQASEAAINGLTKEKIAGIAKMLVDSGNFTTVVMSPEK